MKQITSCNGRELKEMFVAGSRWLEKSVADVNAINVFPVPDGDTGTNMHLTLRSTLEEVDRVADQTVSEVAKAMAQGALMGARGNSGVIMSQFFRGLAKGLEGKESMTGRDWAVALIEASQTAYKGLSQPAEGTILTVIRDASNVAQATAQNDPEDLVAVMEAVVNEAKESVARTPLLLPVLREAGVVDAGGEGWYILMEGALHYLKGEADEIEYGKPKMVIANIPKSAKPPLLAIEKEEPYGYCTNFLLVGQKLNPDKIKSKLEDKGQSIVVAGDDNNVRVHIHTYDPGAILRFATSLGTLHHIQIQNMDDQHEGFMEMQKDRLPKVNVAVVAIVSGDGMKEVFKSLGTAATVSGGQTMNPSVREILQIVDDVPSENIIILPNNKNIVLTAAQVQNLTSKKIAVVPTKTLPQGIAALLVFNYEASLEENAKAMEETISTVKTLEITRAMRSTKINKLSIKEGQAIGIVDDKDIVTAGDDVAQVLLESLQKMDIGSIEVVTIYYGDDIDESNTERIVEEIKARYPKKQVEVVNGGQPHYHYIVSLE
jgi:DAK2 domain fusion protein YloV